MAQTSNPFAARLRRLLGELEYLLGTLAVDGEEDGLRSHAQSITGSEECYNDEELAACAAELYRMRRRRERLFNPELLGEPCWDMLLDLFVNTVRCNPVRVTAACIASSAPTTTALRWLSILEANGLLERYPDPFDRRVVLIRLTSVGLDKMRAILTETCKRGLFPHEGWAVPAVNRTQAAD